MGARTLRRYLPLLHSLHTQHRAQSTQHTAPGHTLPRAPSLLVSSGPPLGVAKSRPDISGTSFPPHPKI